MLAMYPTHHAFFCMSQCNDTNDMHKSRRFLLRNINKCCFKWRISRCYNARLSQAQHTFFGQRIRLGASSIKIYSLSLRK